MTPEMISYFNIDVLHRNFAPPQTEASACALLTRGVGAEERAPRCPRSSSDSRPLKLQTCSAKCYPCQQL
ncbi:hypothetical protein M408DRAFT_126237 [Serendipita vermifera MAFF 305830]|uniref:Uncharacterized protein n=1 Tax=Serendipita vermifera MAFF 305830 TaxID=933852 RepID=A0A0C3BA32_SERVB|nr:hypothetical protein M408DRAFT_126237 [Serendipita vermifera MAFF 305830]